MKNMLPTPDEADHSSRISKENEEYVKAIYNTISNVIRDSYIRGKSLTVHISEYANPEVQQGVRKMVGSHWDVKFGSNSQYNEFNYFVTIQAADEVKPGNPTVYR